MSEVMNIPRLRFPKFDENWEKALRRQAERGQQRVSIIRLQTAADGRCLRTALRHLRLEPIVDVERLAHRCPADLDAAAAQRQDAVVAVPARRRLRVVELRRGHARPVHDALVRSKLAALGLQPSLQRVERLQREIHPTDQVAVVRLAHVAFMSEGRNFAGPRVALNGASRRPRPESDFAFFFLCILLAHRALAHL